MSINGIGFATFQTMICKKYLKRPRYVSDNLELIYIYIYVLMHQFPPPKKKTHFQTRTYLKRKYQSTSSTTSNYIKLHQTTLFQEILNSNLRLGIGCQASHLATAPHAPTMRLASLFFCLAVTASALVPGLYSISGCLVATGPQPSFL